MGFIKRLIVDIAYFLNTSAAYQQKRRFFYNLLESENYRFRKYFDTFMIMLIFISVAILIREVKFEVDYKLLFFNNIVISVIFLIEYLLRVWISSSVSEIIIKQSEHDSMLAREFDLSSALLKITKLKLKYITSFRAIVDLLAILPFFHQLRLLRVFILFRVFKLFRYARSFQTFLSVLSTKKFEFITLMMFSSIVIFVSTVLIYVVEANNENSSIKTIYEAFYWSIVTISTVGYGDYSPVTDAGKLVAMVVIVAGIAVLAFTTSLVVSAFTEKLDEIKDTKIIENISKIKQFYIICGYENVAQEVAYILQKSSTDIIVLDENATRVENAKRDGFKALNYNPGSVESYKKLQIDMSKQVKAILCLRESDVENVYTALTVRSINKDIFILSILMNDANKNKLKFAGVNEILYTQELVGMVAKEFVGQPVAFEVIHALRSQYSNINIEEIFIDDRITNNFTIVKELHNKKYRIIILGIYKVNLKKFFFNPVQTTTIEQGDYLLVVGNRVFIREFEKYLHKKIVK